MSGTRAVTVLFTDVVDSTRLMSGLGARESERVLGAHLAVLRDQIIRFGGTEVKNLAPPRTPWRGWRRRSGSGSAIR